MTLYDLWKKAERELPLHLKISEKYFGNNLAPLSSEMREQYIYEFSQNCPNLFRYINFATKYPLSPRDFQAYLKNKTQKDWSLLIDILSGAPESEILKAKEYCKKKNYTERDFAVFEKHLKETPTLSMSFECSIDMQTKIKFSFESLLLRPETPVNAFDTDETFNMYLWAIGGPVTNGKNVWANCAKNENSQMLKSAIFEQMKEVNLLIKNEEKEK